MTTTSNLRTEFDYKAYIQSEEGKLALTLYPNKTHEEAIGNAVENEVHYQVQRNLSNEGCFVSKNNNIYVFRKTANDFFIIEKLDPKDKNARKSIIEEANWVIAAHKLAQLMCFDNVVDDSVEKDIVWSKIR